MAIVEDSGLASLIGCWYKILDKGLLSAFIEREHPYTNTFHFLVREMTMRLNDVAALLHIPINGRLQ